jgi:hypothetical protein
MAPNTAKRSGPDLATDDNTRRGWLEGGGWVKRVRATRLLMDPDGTFGPRVIGKVPLETASLRR